MSGLAVRQCAEEVEMRIEGRVAPTALGVFVRQGPSAHALG